MWACPGDREFAYLAVIAEKPVDLFLDVRELGEDEAREPPWLERVCLGELPGDCLSKGCSVLEDVIAVGGLQ